MNVRLIAAFLVLLIPASLSYAYKVEVHAVLTDMAAKRSVLAYSGTWRKLGFSSFPMLPVTPYAPESEFIWGVEKGQPVNGYFDYAKIMAFGADIEDTTVEYMGANGTQENFFFSRALNHFFNPQVNKKLFVPVENYTSPSWILEDQGTINKQYFSYEDAQAHFYQVFSNVNSETNRLLYAARTLQTLGHVVHHIQDMAQPQHTRLDPHCDVSTCEAIDNLGYDGNDTSIYEIYTRDIARCDEVGKWTYGLTGAYAYPNSEPMNITCSRESLEDWNSDWTTRTIKLNSYPVVDAKNLVNREPVPRDFWTNENGTGIADFSSKNFVSTDTAFSLRSCSNGACNYGDLLSRLEPHSDDLPHPDGKTDALYGVHKMRFRELISLPSHISSRFGDAYIEFVSSTFMDQYTNQPTTNRRLVSFSMFNERFTRRTFENANPVGVTFPTTVPVRIFTTNYFNMDAHASLLIPRAVGYSAGLINFFFRYKLDAKLISFTQDGDGVDPVATIRIHNYSAYDLSTDYGNFFMAHKSPGKSLRHYRQISIPSGSYKDFNVSFDAKYYSDDDYTGRMSVVFFDEKGGQRPTASAGLYFNIDMTDSNSSVKCDGPIDVNGISVDYETTMSMGSKDGVVTVQFWDASNPDSLMIRNESGRTLYATDGSGSEYHQATINYVADVDGDLNIKVTAWPNAIENPWGLFVSCPN